MTEQRDTEYAEFHRQMISDLLSLRNHSDVLDGLIAKNEGDLAALAMAIKDMLSYMTDDGTLAGIDNVSFRIPKSLVSYASALSIRDQRELIWRLAKSISRDGGRTSLLDDVVQLDRSPKPLYRSGGSGQSPNRFSAETTITQIAGLLHSLETLYDASSGSLEYEFVGVKLFATNSSIGGNKSLGVAALAPMVAELSMKLLIDHCTSSSVPATHDLLRLWRRLTDNQRVSIEAHYKARRVEFLGQTTSMAGASTAADACRANRRTYERWRYPGDTNLSEEFDPLDTEVLRALAWSSYATAISEYRERNSLATQKDAM